LIYLLHCEQFIFSTRLQYCEQSFVRDIVSAWRDFNFLKHIFGL